ncbi:Uncharacterised protein [Shigella sonnei]|nr:Uncharacterised protein [Shigella sonnei]
MRAKDQETQRKERSQIDIFVTGMLIHTERGDNQRQRDAGHQATATVRQVREPAPQQRTDQRTSFKQRKALNRHRFREFQFLERVYG